MSPVSFSEPFPKSSPTAARNTQYRQTHLYKEDSITEGLVYLTAAANRGEQLRRVSHRDTHCDIGEEAAGTAGGSRGVQGPRKQGDPRRELSYTPVEQGGRGRMTGCTPSVVVSSGWTVYSQFFQDGLLVT